jgi:thiol:disulfide interchange protein DsbC
MKWIARVGTALAAVAVAGAFGSAALLAHAQAQTPEATLRKNLGERLTQFQKIDEVSKTPIPGLYEVRIGTDIFYSDAEGNHLIHGEMFDTRHKRNLTEDRVNKLTAVDFASLPVADAITIVRGNGKRKLAIFEDPNCGYCKQFERDLQKVDNVTIYLFLYPILGADSTEKSRSIWCAKDKAQAWLNWMVRDQKPMGGGCDAAALARNVEFGKKHRISGTPTLLFTDGTRVPGAVPAAQVEKLLAAVK